MIRTWLDQLNRRRGGRAAAAISSPGDVSFKQQGDAALADGRLDDAARWYEQGVQHEPGNAWLRRDLGFVRLQQRQFAAAIQALQQALALRRPGDGLEADGLHLLGCAQGSLGQSEEALASFASAARAKPDFAEVIEKAATLAGQLGRHGEAAGFARQLVALRPGLGARVLLARALLFSGARDEALELLHGICAEAPEQVEAAFLRFEALWQLGRLEQALAAAERVLQLTGPDARALANIGFVLEKLDRLDESLARTEEALRLDPGNRGALLNRIAVLIEQKRVPQARQAAGEALRLYPDDADLHWNLSITHLMLGEYREGWKEHEWRFLSAAVGNVVPDLPGPPWRGEDLAGRTLLVYGEQGFGDNLQFVRYVPELARHAGAVLLQVPAALESLVEGLAPNCGVLHAGELLPPFDFHCALVSLPARLGTTLATVPAAVPYLRADPAAVRAWRDRLGADRLNVGICWSGRATQGNDRRRSMSLASFRGLATDGCRFVNLQPQVRESDQPVLADWPGLLDAGRELRDFAQTAALVEALDLVISVDTSVAHLAGALGRPLWVLLAHVPDWRWLLEGEQSPWYPTARLFRQEAKGDWAPVIQRVRAALQARVR